MCVNNMASAEEQKAAIDFLEWLFSSEIGKNYVKNDFQFITVFDQFSQEDCPDNPLAREVSMYLNDENELKKASIYGALDLYLDFINIFLYVLRILLILGKNIRNNN